MPCKGGPWDGHWLTHDRSTMLLFEKGADFLAREKGRYVATVTCWNWEPNMPNLYDGQTDARQGDASTVTTRFRPRYRALSENELELVDGIKSAATTLEELIECAPKGRESSLAMTKLEEAVMWAVKAVTK